MKHQRTTHGLGVLTAVTALFVASADGHTASGGFVDLPRDLEIELALSALPEALQPDATVYVREPAKGFIKHRDGTNGFVTFVARTSVRFVEAGWPFRYPPDQLIPIAFDRVGAKHHMKPFFDIETMRIQGVPADEAKRKLAKAFEDGTYTVPTEGGLSYMLAPIHRAYMAPAQSDEIMTVSFPHLMPYAPYVAAADMGPMDPHNRAGVLDYGGKDSGPHGYMYMMAQPDQVAAIQEKYAGLLERLCDLHRNWCLPEGE